MKDPDTYLISRLRFKHLVLVETLGRLQSIRKAARAVHVSEPAVSKALAEIESSFGFDLFERSPAGVVPTARGEVVIEGTRLLLNSLRHLRMAAATVAGGISLRLGANSFLAQTYVPRLLRALRVIRTDIRVELREGLGPDLMQLLSDGEVDALLIVLNQDEVGEPRTGELVIHTLYTEALTVIAARDHPLVKRRSVSWADLAAEPWILAPAPALVESTIRNMFLSQGIVPPRPRVSSASASTNVGLAAAGLGISAVPAPFARAMKGTGAVEQLKVQPAAHLPPASLVYRNAAADKQAIQALVAATAALATEGQKSGGRHQPLVGA